MNFTGRTGIRRNQPRNNTHMSAIRTLTIALCVDALGFHALADTPKETAEKTVVSVSLKDIPTSQALKYIGQTSGVKVHYAAPVKGDLIITINLKDVPAEQAFAYVAKLAKLEVSYKKDGAFFSKKK